MRQAAVDISCARLAGECDWAQTDLGPRTDWHSAVEHVVTLLLESPMAMAYCHGGRFAMVYNDPLAAILGDRHPKSWAQPLAEVAPEVWDLPEVGAGLERALRTGEPSLEHGNLLGPERGGTTGVCEDVSFVRSVSAVRDGGGRILGLLVVAVETSQGVRTLHTVGDLASALAAAVSVDDVAKATLRHGLHGLEAAAVTLCLPERRAGGWRTTTRRRTDIVSTDEERLPLIWSPAEPGADAVLVRVAEAGARAVSTSRLGTVVVLPLTATGAEGCIAYELSGASPAGIQRAVLETCTELTAEAIARAWLYDTERRTADLLQRTLLPELLPHRRGVTLAVRYQPVTTGTAAGGDFYDVFEVPDGRLAVVMGDVVGRGVAAATVMGQVRAAVRGAALAAPEPDRVFASLDRLVANLDEVASPRIGAHVHRREDPLPLHAAGELFVTMLYCLLDPTTGDVTMASAGHFPPVLMRGSADRDGAEASRRRVEFAGLTVGPPLGIPGDRPAGTGRLNEGDALLAFTDGLLERRDRDLLEGETTLLAALSGVVSREPRTICQQTIEHMLGDGSLEDDCALLALVHTTAVHHTATAVVPPLASAVRRTRVWAERQLATWDVDVDATWVAVMGVSELVTNVLLHAGTEARVTLDLSAERLLVTVADTGTGGVPVRASGDPSATRGRGLGLVAEIAHACGIERNVAGSTVWFEVCVD